MIKKDLSKSEARNFGASKSKSGFLLHIDVDNFLDTTALEVCVKLIKEKNAEAIILHEKVEPKSFWTKARSLERKINISDPDLPSPQLIKADLFSKIGGFDTDVDILDDWTLHLRLKRAKIAFYSTKPFVSIDEVSKLSEMITRNYVRGQAIPYLLLKYPGFKGVTVSGRLKVYLENWQLLLKNPVSSFALIFLKIVDVFALYFGSLNPAGKLNPYDNAQISETYNRLRSATNARLFKNYSEEHALKKLLNSRPQKVLEIGSGTGRITKFLTGLRITVLPTEPSKAMVKEYLRNKSLPKPLIITAESISKKLGKFDVVTGIRVIWHIKNRKRHQTILKNAAIVTEKYVIFDFTNAERFNNLFLGPLYLFYRLLNRNFAAFDHFFTLEEIEELAQKSGLAIEKKIPLDLLTPLWLNPLPKPLARRLFPLLYSLESNLPNFIPPGRWLIRMRKV